MAKYDYLIVGSGLFGACFAHEAKSVGGKGADRGKARPHRRECVYGRCG